MNLPYCKVPCKDCPFRKDTLKGWLGETRMKEILSQKSFTCHKTNKRLQCAGHMIIKGEENDFVRQANIMNIPAPLKGKDLVFDTEQECIKHHS